MTRIAVPTKTASVRQKSAHGGSSNLPEHDREFGTVDSSADKGKIPRITISTIFRMQANIRPFQRQRNPNLCSKCVSPSTSDRALDSRWVWSARTLGQMPTLLIRAPVYLKGDAFLLHVYLGSPKCIAFCVVKVLFVPVTVRAEAADAAVCLPVFRRQMPKAARRALIRHHRAAVLAFDMNGMFGRFALKVV